MNKTTFLLVALTTLAAHASGRPEWLRANFHAHTANTLLVDDGSETPLELHRAVHQAGFAFSVHSVHSTSNKGADAAERFRMEKQLEEALDVPGLTVELGEELTVAEGPRYQHQTNLLGQVGPSNLDHLTLFGIHELVPTKTPLAQACDRAHAEGGVCIVNHPGPGPLMWEEGLWEAAENRGKIDALEVYNGEAMSVFGFDFESRYLQATAYGQLGLKIAAVTGADTHGPESYARSRRQLAGFGATSKLLSFLLPSVLSARPELEAATLVLSDGAGVRDVVSALRERRTVATWALPTLRVECRGLGEVRRSGDVDLALKLSRQVHEVTLYKEGAPLRTWTDVSEVALKEKIDRPAAYVFGVKDGNGRLLTSAIWYSPPAK